MDTLLSLRSDLYYYGSLWIGHLQQTYPGLGQALLTVSSVGDPSKGFVLYFPLILSLHYVKGIRFLGTFIVCEWLNMVTKWLLHADRPYWWVLETGQNISLVQTSLTCETGPGAPSGHSQAGAVVWFCLVDTLLTCIPLPSSLGWTVFFVMQLAMFLSRTFIAAHFPHQCFLGFLTGILLIKRFYTRSSWLQYRTTSLFLISLFLPLSSLAVYQLLLTLGMDPNWSILLAKKHCLKSEWIYVDTTPFYAMVRFSGAALGLSMSGFLSMEMFSSPTLPTRLLALVLGVGLGQATTFTHTYIPRDQGMEVFYTLELLLNTTYVFLVIKVVQLILRTNNCSNIKQPYRLNRKTS